MSPYSIEPKIGERVKIDTGQGVNIKTFLILVLTHSKNHTSKKKIGSQENFMTFYIHCVMNKRVHHKNNTLQA